MSTPRENPGAPSADHQQRRADLLEVVRAKGLRHFDEPRQLSSGELSHDFVDVKRALCRGANLVLACRVIAESVEHADIRFNAVGGLTLGADQFSYGIAAHLGDDHEWFVVRKQPKGRGTDQLIEGAELGAGSRVLLVDDVVTTGGSIIQAHQRVLDTGATIVAAATMVDRGDSATDYFADTDVAYFPVFSYRDLDIEPVGAPTGS